MTQAATKIIYYKMATLSVEYAAKAGVDWIMHAFYMDEPTLEIILVYHREKKRVVVESVL